MSILSISSLLFKILEFTLDLFRYYIRLIFKWFAQILNLLVLSLQEVLIDLCINLQNVRAKSASPLRSASADMFRESSDDEINGKQIQITAGISGI